jgi:tRNA threonylcarbamoyl adenosine modification protein YeaZ
VLVLALDTSAAAVSVAIVACPGGGVFDDLLDVRARQQVVGAHGHGEQLAPAIQRCLTEAAVTPGELAAVVAGTGPGPFTGLRVGLVTAGAFADALGIATYGVCSLDAIDRGAGEEGSPRAVLVATDARRREVYWATYVDGVRASGPEVCKPADVPTGGLTAMAGAGARLYADVLGLPVAGGEYPDPVELVRLALPRLGAPSETLVPRYLRRPDAVPPGAAKVVSQ